MPRASRPAPSGGSPALGPPRDQHAAPRRRAHKPSLARTPFMPTVLAPRPLGARPPARFVARRTLGALPALALAVALGARPAAAQRLSAALVAARADSLTRGGELQRA